MKDLQKAGFLKLHAPLIAELQHLLDPICCVLSFFLVFTRLQGPLDVHQYLSASILFLLVYVLFDKFGAYRSWRASTLFDEARQVLGAALVLFAAAFALERFAPDGFAVSNEVFLWWALTFAGTLVAIRLTARLGLRWLRKRGRNTRTVVIAGSGNLGQLVAQRILKAPEYGMTVQAFFDDKWTEERRSVSGIPVEGTLDAVADFVKMRQIDVVYIALPLRAEERMKGLLKSLLNSGSSIFFVPDIFAFQLLKTRIEDLNGIPVFSLLGQPLRNIEIVVKRLFDLIVSFIVVLIISPLLVLIALAIRLNTRGPVLYKQIRYGLNNEEILVYKFRTMTVCEEGDQITQTRRDDPRVTSVGKFLRRTSLDELPQFFNVLKGNMSVVGPRPHAVAHNLHYGPLIEGYILRHRVKPGITGWAQINGWRGETDTLEKMQKRIEYDLEYIRNWSLWLDIKIIFLTVIRGFGSQNAY